MPMNDPHPTGDFHPAFSEDATQWERRVAEYLGADIHKPVTFVPDDPYFFTPIFRGLRWSWLTRLYWRFRTEPYRPRLLAFSDWLAETFPAYPVESTLDEIVISIGKYTLYKRVPVKDVNSAPITPQENFRSMQLRNYSLLRRLRHDLLDLPWPDDRSR